MTSHRWIALWLAIGLVGVSTANAQHTPLGAGHGSHPHRPHWWGGGGGGGGGGFHPAPIVVGWVPIGLMPLPPPIIIVMPGPISPAGPALPPPVVAQGLGGVGQPAQPLSGPRRAALRPVERAKHDPTRASQLLTLGDRLFRSGNLKRASERYEQALAANPDAAAPRVRLAQVALVRGRYTEAAHRFREAQAAEPGWVINAPDIQAIYGEPREFTAAIARLETHLQVHPNDRDAWMVLGAQWYLSGRTRQAADVFQRLSDRQPDPTLSAFLVATTPPAPARQ